jgi:hypothetical protein
MGDDHVANIPQGALRSVGDIAGLLQSLWNGFQTRAIALFQAPVAPSTVDNQTIVIS